MTDILLWLFMVTVWVTPDIIFDGLSNDIDGTVIYCFFQIVADVFLVPQALQYLVTHVTYINKILDGYWLEK